jgi:hypothetical protein
MSENSLTLDKEGNIKNMSENSLTLYKEEDNMRSYVLSFNGVKLGIKGNIFGIKIMEIDWMEIKRKIKKNKKFNIIDINEIDQKPDHLKSDDDSNDYNVENDDVNESKEKEDDNNAFSRAKWYFEHMFPKIRLALCDKYLHFIVAYGCGMISSYTEFKIEIKKNYQLIYKFLNMLEYYKNELISECITSSDEESDVGNIDNISNNSKKGTYDQKLDEE